MSDREILHLIAVYGYLFGAAVLRVGDILAAASIPFALLILVIAGVGLHLAEGHLQRQADRAERRAA